MKEQKKKSIVTGVMLLSVSGIIVKIMGLLYKIPLANLLGNEGMGYFTGAYTIYLLFYTIATAGLPIALSILIARARVTGGATLVARIDKITSALFAVVGLTSFAVLGFGSAFFANAVGNPKSVYAVAAISPSILFVCIMGAVRGYFQGHKIMLPSEARLSVGKSSRICHPRHHDRLSFFDGASPPHEISLLQAGK